MHLNSELHAAGRAGNAPRRPGSPATVAPTSLHQIEFDAAEEMDGSEFDSSERARFHDPDSAAPNAQEDEREAVLLKGIFVATYLSVPLWVVVIALIYCITA